MKLLGRYLPQLLVSFSLILLISCGGGPSNTQGGSGGANSSPPNNPPAPVPSQEFVYLSNDALYVSTLNTNTGTLSPFVLAGPDLYQNNLFAPPVASQGNYLYVQGLNEDPRPGPSGEVIFEYSIDRSTGLLTPLPSSPYLSQQELIGQTQNVIMDPQGKHLYISDDDGPNSSSQDVYSLNMFNVDTATGAIQNGPVFQTTAYGQIIAQAIDPNDKYLYATESSPAGTGISVLKIDPTTGALTEIQGSPFIIPGLAGGNTPSIYTNPSGNFLYALPFSVGLPAYVFSVDPMTGTLAAIPGSPFQLGGINNSQIIFSAVLSPDGKFIYVSSVGSTFSIGSFSGSILVFPVDITNGAIATTPVFSTANTNGGHLHIDPSGSFLFSSDNILSVMAFAIDKSTGSLTPITGAIGRPGDWGTVTIVKTPNN